MQKLPVSLYLDTRRAITSKDRLDEYLNDFEPSHVDEYLEYQFAQHQLDDHFREKANDYKTRQAQQKVPLNRNPPPVPPKQ